VVKLNVESIVLNACITVFSLGMLIVSLISYKKSRNSKLIFVSFAFLIFFIKGMIQSLGLFYIELASMNSNIYLKLFDLSILIFLFIATLKR